MPNGNYMEPNEIERKAARILALLDELDANGAYDPQRYRKSIDSRVYNKGVTDEDVVSMRKRLINRLQEIPLDVLQMQYSLDIQLWWHSCLRDEVGERIKLKTDRDLKHQRSKALSKLSKEDRKALGL